MEMDKASAEIARMFRAVFETMADKIKWDIRKDAEDKIFKKREADFKASVSSRDFPIVESMFRKHEHAYRRQDAEVNRELSKVDALFEKLTREFVDNFVKHMPFSDIKTQQLVDLAEAEMVKVLHGKSTSTDNRFDVLEKQMASLREVQEAQASELIRIKEENKEIRARNNSYEAQATELAALKAQYEELQAQLGAKSLQESEMQRTKGDVENLETQVTSLRSELSTSTTRLEGHYTGVVESLKQVREEVSAAAATPPDITLAQDMAALRRQVDELDNQLSSFDVKEYNEAMTKLLSYPAWFALDTRICEQKAEIQRLKDDKSAAPITERLQSELREVRSIMDAYRRGSDLAYKGFSNNIIEKVHKLLDDAKQRAVRVESRLKPLEDQVATMAAAASASTATATLTTNSDTVVTDISKGGNVGTEASDGTLRQDFLKLYNDVNSLRNETSMTLRAHTIAIESLDDQFKNLTTSELAHIILEHLRRVAASGFSLDLQNFHERLSTVELFQQGQAKRENALQQIGLSWANRLDAPSKRSLNTDEPNEQQEKRRKVQSPGEGVRGLASE